MLRLMLNSILYALLITGIYSVAANVGYYIFNRRSMFADVYFYEWVEYAIVAGIILFSTIVIELVRNLIRAKNKIQG